MSNKQENPPVPHNSKEAAGLDSYLSLLNSIPQLPPTEGAPPPPPAPVLPPNPEIMSFIAAPLPPQPELPRTNPRKLFFTGRLKSGKDYAAKASGAVIFGFADPLYAIATHFFGVTVNASEGKDIPGVRAFLQQVGQWGRAAVTEQYPLTVGRALFSQAVREAGAAGKLGHPEVEWDTYGKNPDIWLNACIFRADLYLNAHPNARVAITNCRFENEFKRLTEEKFQHWHCMCGPKTWATRLAESKLTPESPAVKDLSEQLAVKLDQNVIKQVSAIKAGPMLRAIWSDTGIKPNPRLHSIQSFLQTVGGAP